jgi:hypothetical protein
MGAANGSLVLFKFRSNGLLRTSEKTIDQAERAYSLSWDSYLHSRLRATELEKEIMSVSIEYIFLAPASVATPPERYLRRVLSSFYATCHYHPKYSVLLPGSRRKYYSENE